MQGLNRVLEFFAARAWALEERTLGILTAIVERHTRGEKITAEELLEVKAAKHRRATARRAASDSVGFHLETSVPGVGIAVVPITGVIARYSSQVDGISGPTGTSIERIRADFAAAEVDPSVHAILFDVDSPGGSIDDVAEMSEEIASSAKPVFALADGMAASAAYWLVAGAAKIWATRSTRVGSLGIFVPVVDSSAAAEAHGLKVTIVKAGAFKGTGVAGAPISDAQLAEVQREVDGIYDLLVESVAAGRGLELADARALSDGRIHIGANATRVGLVDGIKNYAGAIAAIGVELRTLPEEPSAELEASTTTTETEPMAKAPTDPPAAPTLAELTLEGLRSGNPTLLQAIEDAAVQGERARAVEILDSAHAKQLPEALGFIRSGAPVVDALKGFLVSRTTDREARLDKLGAESTDPLAPTDDATAVADMTAEDRAAKEWADNTANVRGEFGSVDEYEAYLRNSKNARTFGVVPKSA